MSARTIQLRCGCATTFGFDVIGGRMGWRVTSVCRLHPGKHKWAEERALKELLCRSTR